MADQLPAPASDPSVLPTIPAPVAVPEQASEAAVKEAIDKIQAEKVQADKVQAEKDQAEKDRAEKDKIERDRIEKDRVEKDRIEKDRIEKDRIERDRAEKEKAAKDKAAKDKADLERVERDKAERDKILNDKPGHDKEPKDKPEHEKDSKDKPQREKDPKEKPEHEKVLKEKPEHERDLQVKPEHDKDPKDKPVHEKDKAEKGKAEVEHDRIGKEKPEKDKAAAGGTEKASIAPAEAIVKPVQKSFTTPAGQTVTVIEKQAEPVKAVEQLQASPPAPPVVVVTEVKKVVEEQKAGPALAPTSVVAKVVEDKKIVENKVDPALPPTVITEKKVVEKLADGSTNTTAVITKSSDAATIHEMPLTDKPALPDLRKVKTDSQLAKSAVSPALIKDIGLLKTFIAPADTILIWKEKIASATKEDFKITDIAGKHIFELSRRYFSRTKHLTTAFGKPVLAIRKASWSKNVTSWDVTTPGKKQVMTIRGGNRMYFHNIIDNSGTDLFLSGAYWRNGGATLHLGTTEAGPTVARIESEVVAAAQGPLLTPGLPLHQYTLTIVKGFDIALACAAVVALDGERWNDAKARKKFGWGFMI